MSRYDGKFTAADDATLDAAELLAALGAQSRLTSEDRTVAIARYLAASDGWRDAARLLGGAFAGEKDATESPPRQGTGLSRGKEE